MANTAILSCPKTEGIFRAWFSTLIELDFCVRGSEAAGLHHRFPECILDNDQTCFIHYQEAAEKAEQLSQASTG